MLKEELTVKGELETAGGGPRRRLPQLPHPISGSRDHGCIQGADAALPGALQAQAKLRN
jgi:hypothetical protein